MKLFINTARRAKGGKPDKSPRRQTRGELNQQARERKRQKKRRGNPPGSRANPALLSGGTAGAPSAVARDPRIGSVKPVPLQVMAESLPAPSRQASASARQLTPEQALARLENDTRLNALLDRLEAGESLDDGDQRWVEQTLARVERLMAQLGIRDEDDRPPKEDLMRLLRGG